MTQPPRIASVLIPTPEPEAALAWYEQAFAGSQRVTFDEFSFTALRIGDVHLECVLADQKVQADAAGTVVYWAVDDLDAALHGLQALGGVLYRGPRPIEDGLAMCQVRDPWDNCIGLRGPSAAMDAWLGPTRDLDTLVAQFTAVTLPQPAWTHQAHVLVGAWHVEQFGPAEALTRLREAIRRLNDAHGTPNSETRGYHETITRAYVELLADVLARRPLGTTLRVVLADLLRGPVGERDVLLRFYSKDRLMSREARAAWVEPDLAPLSAPTAQ